jgi:hypothetical protein
VCHGAMWHSESLARYSAPRIAVCHRDCHGPRRTRLAGVLPCRILYMCLSQSVQVSLRQLQGMPGSSRVVALMIRDLCRLPLHVAVRSLA